MWIFSKHGFFSAVEYKENPKLVMVRARFKGDLERFCNHHFGVMLAQGDFKLPPNKKIEDCYVVAHTPEADYPYRTVLVKEQFAMMLAQEALEIDYTNFKDKVHDGDEPARDASYFGVWQTMRDAQD